MLKIKKGVYVIATLSLLFSATLVFGNDYDVSGVSNTKTGTVTDIQKIRDKNVLTPEQVREKMERRKDDFRKKVDAIRDQKKKDMANGIVEQINHINRVWTNHFTNVLNKLEGILQKVKSRRDKVAGTGKDVTAINTAIQKAESAIGAARVAVTTQSQKIYVADTSNVSATSGENNLVSAFRSRFKSLKEELFKDLFALRDGVMKDTRTAIHDAFKTLSPIPNVDRESEEENSND